MFKKWSEKRKKRKAQVQFEAGFGWAMTQYFIHKVGLFDLGVWPDAARTFGNYTQFDEGVNQAIRAIRVLLKDDAREFGKHDKSVTGAQI